MAKKLTTAQKDFFHNRMMDIYDFIKLKVAEGNRLEVDDVHWSVCNLACMEFELGDSFPNWLMFIVSGEMRQQGGGA